MVRTRGMKPKLGTQTYNCVSSELTSLEEQLSEFVRHTTCGKTTMAKNVSQKSLTDCKRFLRCINLLLST